MAGSGGFALSSRKSNGQIRFYNPPAMRRHQQMMLPHSQYHQQQTQKPANSDSLAQVPLDEDSVTPMSQPTSGGASSPPPSNLDRFLESVTPSLPARHFSEVKSSERRTGEAETNSFYLLGDLWDSFSEWSLYGVGVPLLLNGEDNIKQYYVPFLSGIQLYVNPSSKPRPLFRKSSQDDDAELSMETSVGGGCDYVSDKNLKSVVDGLPNQHRLVNNSQLNRHLRTEKSALSSSGDEAEIANSPGQLLFEYLEPVQPHNRSPLVDKISVLASQFPELRKCRSCDLLPSSWISVAWYPIYRIPMGSTLRDLDASFLTFHYLSTQPRCTSRIQFSGVSSKKGPVSVDTASKISLPVFGLAMYKRKGSILSPYGANESEKEKSLLEAADTWLKELHVVLPDYQFFRANYSQRQRR